MDLSVLPDIFALALLIGAYRPLVRRAGAHVNLWFVGWGFVLLQALTQMFSAPGRPGSDLLHLLGLAFLELCGLSFVLAAANARKRQMESWFAVGLGLPMMAQIGLCFVEQAGLSRGPHSTAHFAVNLLFLTPLALLMTGRKVSRQAFLVIALLFAVFGLATLSIAATHPALVTIGTLTLIYLCAAFLCVQDARGYSHGVAATVVGLGLWGLKYPFMAAMHTFYPGIRLAHGLMELPQYMVVAGSILTLLEEHLVRTERLAMHDALTDLPNRRLFGERFAAAMEEARRDRTTVACLVIDVDDFKRINDTMGHAVGDELLRALAVRLSWHMSPRDMLARTGGDEFTAMLAGVKDEHHLRFIASAMMSAASVPVVVEGLSIEVRISMGIALSPDHADDIAGLRARADEAMYCAKRTGGNMLAFAGETRIDEETEAAERHAATVLQMKPLADPRRAGRASRG